MLIQLPPEVIQNILWHMDPGTLLVSLFVCKRLYNIANSKHVLLHQLYSMPGLTIGLEDLSTSDTLAQYKLRAVRNLCGSDVLAQLTRYSAGRDKINVRQCVFCPGRVAIAYQHRSVIKLYDFRGDRTSKGGSATPSVPGRGTGLSHRASKIAFSQDRDVVGLYRYTPHMGNGGPFVAEAVEKARHIRLSSSSLITLLQPRKALQKDILLFFFSRNERYRCRRGFQTCWSCNCEQRHSLHSLDSYRI
jgi:hypothetical protein